MRKVVKTRMWLTACTLVVMALSACAEEAPDYSGKYEPLMGQNCDMVGLEDAFVELALATDGQAASYLARFPSAAQPDTEGNSPVRSNRRNP